MRAWFGGCLIAIQKTDDNKPVRYCVLIHIYRQKGKCHNRTGHEGPEGL